MRFTPHLKQVQRLPKHEDSSYALERYTLIFLKVHDHLQV